jgi:hypothetical protein
VSTSPSTDRAGKQSARWHPRSVVRHRRCTTGISPRRSSTAAASDVGVYRRASRSVRSRVDLQVVAHRPVDILRTRRDRAIRSAFRSDCSATPSCVARFGVCGSKTSRPLEHARCGGSWNSLEASHVQSCEAALTRQPHRLLQPRQLFTRSCEARYSNSVRDRQDRIAPGDRALSGGSVDPGVVHPTTAERRTVSPAKAVGGLPEQKPNRRVSLSPVSSFRPG